MFLFLLHFASSLVLSFKCSLFLFLRCLLASCLKLLTLFPFAVVNNYIFITKYFFSKCHKEKHFTFL
jgi:hypothetical protein